MENKERFADFYDALSYTDQIKQLWDSHNRGKGEGLSEDEYLSRFRKGDKQDSSGKC